MSPYKKRFIFSIYPVLQIFCFSALSQSTKEIGYHFNKRVVCHHGAVVSAHPLASLAGIHILKIGGNAVDAAISTQLALAVVYPGAGNIGGGGFVVARLAGGKNIAIDFRETAPGTDSRILFI